MDPTSNPIIVEIGGRPITLHFDFNTYKKFEELTKKFFMNWFGELQNASFKLIKDVRHSQKMSSISRNDDGQLVDNKGRVLTPDEAIQIFLDTDIDLLGILRHTSMTDFSAFVYAAAHEYDSNRRPIWRIEQADLDAALDMPTFQKLLPIILNAAGDNGPRRKAEEVTEPARPTNLAPVPKPRTGGSSSGESPAAILDSLPKRRRA
jgi:uncharacterized ubiquitin-like protein YukD